MTSPSSMTFKMRYHHGTKHYFFDRRTFNPNENKSHLSILNRLRSVGRRRTWWFLNGRAEYQHHGYCHHDCCASHSFREYHAWCTPDDSILDIGCGDSADRLVAKELGLEAIGLDLVPPVFEALKEGLIQVDMVEPLPFKEHSFDAVICQAVLDLVRPDERVKVYSNVYSVLKIGGLFTANIVGLTNGWGFDLNEERRKMLSAGLIHVKGNTFQREE
jgi:SAM-dependent methyltransferase